MKGERKSREMRDQVLDLHRRKHGKKTIVRMLGLSRNTVKGIINAAEAGTAGNGAEPTPKLESIARISMA